MRSGSIWAELGVRPDADRSAVRRGYAARLKETNPEDDPEGFQALRAAYDQALMQVQWREQGYDVEETDEEAHFNNDGGLAPEDAGIDGVDAAAAEATRSSTLRDDRASPLHDDDAGGKPSAEPTLASAGASPDPEAVHQAAMRRFAGLAQSEHSTPEALRAALDEILRSPAMSHVSVGDDTERWLAYVVLENQPRADAVVGRLVDAFGWAKLRGRWDAPPEINALLEREGDLQHLAALTRPGSTYHRAFKALSAPITDTMRRKGVPKALRRDVRLLIARINALWPSLIDHFDREAVDWWLLTAKRRQGVWSYVRWTAGGVLALFLALILVALTIDPAPSVDELRRAAEAAPQNALAWVDLCDAVATTTRLEPTALAECERAVRLEPSSLRAMEGLGLIQLRLSQNDRAAETYKALLTLSPNNARALYGRALSKSVDDFSRIADLQLALSIDPSIHQAFDLYGTMQFGGASFDTLPSPEDGDPPPVSDPPPEAALNGYAPPDWTDAPKPELRYPTKALDEGVAGNVLLRCRVAASGALRDCLVWSERPQGYGFADAALSQALKTTMKPATYRGRPVDGAVVRIPFGFNMAGADGRDLPTSRAASVANAAEPVAAPRSGFQERIPTQQEASGSAPVYVARASVYVPSELLPKPANPDPPPLGLLYDERGAARLRCNVAPAGRLTGCRVLSESKAGVGLAERSLSDAQYQRVRPATRDGKPVDGGWVEFEYSYRPTLRLPPREPRTDPSGGAAEPLNAPTPEATPTPAETATDESSGPSMASKRKAIGAEQRNDAGSRDDKILPIAP